MTILLIDNLQQASHKTPYGADVKALESFLHEIDSNASSRWCSDVADR